MITDHKIYLKKFPTSKDFQNYFPPGKKFHWCDRKTVYHVAGFFQDGDSDLIILKYYNKYKKGWYYNCMDSFLFYSIYEMLEREGIL